MSYEAFWFCFISVQTVIILVVNIFVWKYYLEWRDASVKKGISLDQTDSHASPKVAF